jgi:hypothetical protein
MGTHSFVALLQHQCLWILSGVLGAAAALTAVIHPNRIGLLCSWGLIPLSPCCNTNAFGFYPASFAT